MSNQNPKTVATAYFDALGAGDVATAMGLLSPSVAWHQPGDNQFSGVHTGIEAVGAVIGGMMQVSRGTFALTVSGAMMTNGESVAVPVRFTGERDGAVMDMAGVDLLTIRDGKIAEVHLYSEDPPAEDAFWGAAASR